MQKYSQYDEQEHILRAVQHLQTGKFLDIGAWDPFDKSNSRALFELGWSGVMVEPSPAPMRKLVEVYGKEPRVTLIEAALGLAESPLLTELQITDDATSTSDVANYDKWKEKSSFLGRMFAPRITWRDIFNQFGAFDVINLDAEGISVPLLLELLTIPMRPKVIIVEHDDRIVEASEPANALGYVNVYNNGTNIVFVHQR